MQPRMSGFSFRWGGVLDLEQDAKRSYALYSIRGAVQKGAPRPRGGPQRHFAVNGAVPPLPHISSQRCQLAANNVSRSAPLERLTNDGDSRDAKCNDSKHFNHAKAYPSGWLERNRCSRRNGDGGDRGVSNRGRGEACLRPTDPACLHQVPYCAPRADELRQSLQGCGQSGAKEEIGLEAAPAWCNERCQCSVHIAAPLLRTLSPHLHRRAGGRQDYRLISLGSRDPDNRQADAPAQRRFAGS